MRETVDTGELGEFMPQLSALVAVNPESEHFGVVRVNGITSAMTFPAAAGAAGAAAARAQYISGQAALIHTGRLDLGRDGDQPRRGGAVEVSQHGRARRTRRRHVRRRLPTMLGEARAPRAEPTRDAPMTTQIAKINAVLRRRAPVSERPRPPIRRVSRPT